MDLRRLEYFLVLAQFQHFGRAAESLHISQPGLSQQIRVLENELGARLIDRGTKPISLTLAGELLLERGQPLLAQVNSCVQQVKQAGQRPTGNLRVAYTRSGRELNMNALVEEYRRVYPEVALSLTSDWTVRNLELLESGDIDVAFARSLSPDRQLESLTIAREELVVAIPATHALAELDRVSFEDVVDLPLVHWSRLLGADYFDDIRMQIWGDRKQKIYMEQPDTESILSEVARGIGIAVVDEREATRLLPSGVCLRHFFDPPPRTTLSVAWLPGTTQPPALSAFVEMCKTHDFAFSR